LYLSCYLISLNQTIYSWNDYKPRRFERQLGALLNKTKL
jgi:hypothetical protein